MPHGGLIRAWKDTRSECQGVGPPLIVLVQVSTVRRMRRAITRTAHYSCYSLFRSVGEPTSSQSDASVCSNRLIRGSFTLIRFHTRTVHSLSQRTRDLTVSLTLTRSHMRAALSLSQLISLSRCIRSHLPPHAHRAHSLTQFIHSQVPFTCTGAAHSPFTHFALTAHSLC